MSGIFRTYDVEYFTFGPLHQTTYYLFGIVKNVDANNLSFPTLYGKPLQIYK